MVPHFYYHPGSVDYDFGPRHPLKPERLRRMLALLGACFPGNEILEPAPATVDDALNVHGEAYLEVIQALSRGIPLPKELAFMHGFTGVDTPPFAGMWEASCAYSGATLAACRAVMNGAPFATNMAGGLHHARREMASGFCILNDVALACALLRERFGSVLYVDIDLHHGDGVEMIFDADAEVATFSIHESGRTLYPGTGFVADVGRAQTAFNLPLVAGTTGDVWLRAFLEVLPRVVDAVRPSEIVLQAGCDAHFWDPLGHLRVTTQEWRGAVRAVRDLGLPLVMTGGGGYDLRNVPRMWVGAVADLAGQELPPHIPESIPTEWNLGHWDDAELPTPRESGRADAESTIDELRATHPRLR